MGIMEDVTVRNFVVGIKDISKIAIALSLVSGVVGIGLYCMGTIVCMVYPGFGVLDNTCHSSVVKQCVDSNSTYGPDKYCTLVVVEEPNYISIGVFGFFGLSVIIALLFYMIWTICMVGKEETEEPEEPR